MPDLREGNLVFTFRDATLVGQVDRWAFYRNRFSSIPGTKAVDFEWTTWRKWTSCTSRGS